MMAGALSRQAEATPPGCCGALSSFSGRSKKRRKNRRKKLTPNSICGTIVLIRGRIGAPEDITGIVLYCKSPASDFIIGQVFVVNGGISVPIAYNESPTAREGVLKLRFMLYTEKSVSQCMR